MRIFTMVVLLLAAGRMSGQSRVITGRLVDESGPLPGVNVVVKGTTTGTVTDADGRYTITAPVGSTLVFSFIGMTTKEVVVTATNFKTTKSTNQPKKKIIPTSISFFTDTVPKNSPGVTFLTEETPVYFNRNEIQPTRIRSIRKRNSGYFVTSYRNLPRLSPTSAQFTSFIGIENVNKFPSFQSAYSQGRPVAGGLQWQGPDQQEIFSWGPLIKTLEFDGGTYDFDRNGRLVRAGLGNGKQAIRYNPLDFFKTGISSGTEFTIIAPAFRRGTMIVDLERTFRQGIIPNSNHDHYNVNLRIKDFVVNEQTKVTAYTSYHSSTGNLLNRGANLATIVGSVFGAPITFDNSNGFNSSAALQHRETYLLNDGTSRSYAPIAVNNPYQLVNQLPDHENQDRFISSLGVNYAKNDWEITSNAEFDRQNNNIYHGFFPGYAGFVRGRITERKENQSSFNALIAPSYSTVDSNYGRMKISGSYQINYTQRNLSRRDGYGFSGGEYNGETSDSTVILNKRLSRVIHETSLNFQYRHDNALFIKLSNRNYFSNTINTNYVNLFPSLGLSIDLPNLIGVYIDQLQPYASISRTIREAPLIYSNWSYGSVRTPVSAYRTYNENTELFFSSALAPETEVKFETGVRAQFRRLNFEFNYFDNLTYDFITPSWDGNQFLLTNAARIKNTGVLLSLKYDSYSYGKIQWGASARWTTYNSVVQELNSTQPYIQLAGFESIATVLAAGQPVGAIYGTSFQRNSKNQIVIGNDGFPLVDPTLKMIGNPIPDWVMNISSYLEWNRLKLSATFDFKKGGESWNGTNRMLDYFGMSESTSAAHNVTNYVFDGVDINGVVNTKPVDFASTSQPLESNRWVRYGAEGVGEEYIQKTSWIRLSEVSLSYATKRTKENHLIKEARFTMVGRNLVLITPYQGVDPSSNLFGNSTGSALDLFNTPATRTYTASVILKF